MLFKVTIYNVGVPFLKHSVYYFMYRMLTGYWNTCHQKKN